MQKAKYSIGEKVFFMHNLTIMECIIDMIETIETKDHISVNYRMTDSINDDNGFKPRYVSPLKPESEVFKTREALISYITNTR